MTGPAQDAGKRHGRGCACTPCRAEDWDAVERGIREAQDAGNSPERLEGMDVQALANTVREGFGLCDCDAGSAGERRLIEAELRKSEEALDALETRVEELERGLILVHQMACYGPGDDTSVRETLDTIAAFVAKRLDL